MQPNIFDHATLPTAFQAVKENHGCAGVDGVTIERFEENLPANLEKLRQELADRTYSPLPLMKILVAKKNGEARGLCIPVIRDRVAMTAVLHRIGPILEKEFEECSYAYRKGRSVRKAVYKIKEYYDQGFRWVAESDIDAFFDNVDHELLLGKFKRIISDPWIGRLVEMWLRVEIWDGTTLTRAAKGLPQGSPVSPVLANLFLDELDEAMLAQGLKYIRYADDYLLLAKTPQEAGRALELSKQVLDRLLLKLDEEEITSFAEGFKYLGVIFVNSLIMTPFAQSGKKRRVLFYPPPFDLAAYLDAKKQEP